MTESFKEKRLPMQISVKREISKYLSVKRYMSRPLSGGDKKRINVAVSRSTSTKPLAAADVK